VRVTTAFSRLVRMPEAWVRKVRFEPDRVIVEVALRRRRLICPECGYSTAARKDTRPEKSVWRHLDLGVWRLEIRCRRRRLWCPEHGARTEGVPFARPGSEFTRDFERLVAWLATRTDKSTIKRVLRIDWDTVGRIIKRVCDDELDPDRLNDLFDIGIDEVSWKKQHNYLTLVADHRRGKIVWGTAGKGEQAADSFFAELDSPPDHRSERATQPRRATEPAIMVPFGPCPTVPAGHGIQAISRSLSPPATSVRTSRSRRDSSTAAAGSAAAAPVRNEPSARDTDIQSPTMEDERPRRHSRAAHPGWPRPGLAHTRRRLARASSASPSARRMRITRLRAAFVSRMFSASGSIGLYGSTPRGACVRVQRYRKNPEQ